MFNAILTYSIGGIVLHKYPKFPKQLTIFVNAQFVVQLAGVVAVEITGGPTVPFVPGRKVDEFKK